MKTQSTEKRAKILELWRKGWSVSRACAKTGISLSTGYRAVRGRRRPRKG